MTAATQKILFAFSVAHGISLYVHTVLATALFSFVSNSVRSLDVLAFFQKTLTPVVLF